VRVKLTAIAGIIALTSALGRAQDPPATTQPAQATRPSFSEFLEGIRTEALARGIKPELVEDALSNIEEPMPIVLERDRTQAETVLSLEKYLSQRLTPKRIRTGREMLEQHRELLDRVAARYHVPPPIIVAIWGVESEYGRLSGIRPTIAALATLAWDPRRSTFFRGELFNALDIVNRGDIDLAAMKGSWAGAMGQPQFMPSSYLKYAEDFNDDGRKDIWSTPDDIFASIANYLVGYGWTADEPWGREVRATPAVARRISNDVARREGGCRAIRDMTVPRPLKDWRTFGVRLANGDALPSAPIEASLVSGAVRHFLVYRNYDALLGYNCANSYALGVALLADRIASPASADPVVKSKSQLRKKPPPRKARR
jgi:peptidoglycan lytic transglycosylase B